VLQEYAEQEGELIVDETILLQTIGVSITVGFLHITIQSMFFLSLPVRTELLEVTINRF